MRSFESNLAFVQACLAEILDYERAGQLFWTLSARPPAGSPAFLQMTLGNLALALDEIQSVEATLSPKNRAVLLSLQTEWETHRAESSAQLKHKAMQEANSRIAQWRTYVAEAVVSGDLTEYAVNVRPRLCALRLMEWLGADHPGVREAYLELAAIEVDLAPRMEEGPFVLDPQLAAVYPPTAHYRFLYVRPLLSTDPS